MLMAEAIDEFLETSTAKKNGITSRSDFVTRILSTWFHHYKKDGFMNIPIVEDSDMDENNKLVVMNKVKN